MFWSSLLDIIFPPLCLVCEAEVGSGEVVCRQCLEIIPIQRTLFCGQCRARLPAGKKICHFSSPCLAGAATNYETPAVKKLIHALKFKGTKNAAASLADFLVRYIQNTGVETAGWLVVPVPLGKSRLRQRGYNQAAEIARHFAERLSLRWEENCLRRIRDTRPQTELHSAAERLANVLDCFVAEESKLRGQQIILIDDVITSGATILAAAAALKQAGAKNILALAAAQA